MAPAPLLPAVVAGVAEAAAAWADEPARSPAQPYPRGVSASRSPTQTAEAPYLHPTVVMESAPSIACPAKVSPVREAEVSPHTMPVS